MSDFVHLHVHSYYSLLDATASPEELLQRAAQLGMRHLALTDSNALYGAVEFYRAARSHNIHAIIGAELTIRHTGKLAFFAKNQMGYHNLSRLITVGRMRGGHLAFDLELRDIIGHHAGLFVLSGGQEGKLWDLVQSRDLEKAHKYCRQMKNIFGNSFHIEAQHFAEKDRLYNLRLRDMAQIYHIPLIATNNVHFLRPADWTLRRTLHAIGQNTNIDRITHFGSANQYLKSAGEMRETLSYLPESLTRTTELAEQCTFAFSLGRPVFPRLDLPAGRSTTSQLRKLSFDGVRERYKHPDLRTVKRLRDELQVISDMGFADYFLIVKEIVDFCREEDIPCVGRGSAGDSLIAYLLGITQVDPIRYNLYFERFLKRERKDPPDIDLDIDWVNRDRVIRFVFERFGRDRTAMISTFNTFQLRSSIRDVAKAYGFPEDEVKTMLRFLPRFGIRELAKSIDRIPHCRHLRANLNLLQIVLKYAERISDFPRHLSIHAGGVIIAPADITHFTPLEVAGKGITVSQYDMYSIEPLGLVKMDLLGVRALSVVSETVRVLNHSTVFRPGTANRNSKEDEAAQVSLFADTLHSDSSAIQEQQCPPYRIDMRQRRIVAENGDMEQYLSRFPFLRSSHQHYALLDTRRLPTNDIAVTNMLRAGMTMGCFQLESPAMRNLLAKMQITGVDDIIAAVALIRPGAADSGMKDLYILRRAGIEPVSYPTQLLKPILADTYGIIVYQEQVMQIAASLARFTLAQGDYLRRAMTKAKKRKEILKLRRHFVEGVIANELGPQVADTVWDFLKNFVGYGFNKAHAAIYGVIAYQSAFLKYYFPVPFMTAVLNNQGGFYHTAAYLEECRRLGMEILPPDINASEGHFTWQGRQIRVGLDNVFELTHHTLDRIVSERQRSGPYRDYYDFITRVKPRLGEAENLIKCGALRSLNPNTPAVLLQNHLFYKNKFRRARVEPVLQNARLTPYSVEQQLRYEIDLLSLGVSDHPLRLFEHNVDRETLTPSYELEKKQNQRVRVLGWRIAARRLRTRSDEYMQFLTLEDRYGLVETIMFPKEFKKFGEELQGAGPYLVEGTIQSRMPGEANLIVERLKRVLLK